MHTSYESLRVLGFSSLMIRCHTVLYDMGTASHLQLVGACNGSNRGTKQALEKLEVFGFVYSYGSPKHYIAQPIWLALPAYHEYQRITVRALAIFQEQIALHAV